MGPLLIKSLFCSSGFRLASRTLGARLTRAKCSVGDKATTSRRISKDDVMHFARLTGDTNPIHISQDGEIPVVHGALLNSIVSGVIGTQLPGPGTVVAWQILNFPEKCYAEEVVIADVEVVNARKVIVLKFKCRVDQCSKSGKKKCVLYGEAKVVQR